MSFGYLTQALASSAFLKNSDPIDFEWPPADMSSLQPGAAHSRIATPITASTMSPQTAPHQLTLVRLALLDVV